MITALEHALELVRHGIPVFPCKPDKSPLTKNGFKDAVTNEHMVRRMFGPVPDALVGVPTGIKFDVLDIDLPNEQAREWVRARGLPSTRWHTSRRGGLHGLFQPNTYIKNSTSKLDPKIDTRGKGGYIIWWPAHGGAVENEHALAPWPDDIVDAFAAIGDPHPRTREEEEIERPAPRKRKPVDPSNPFNVLRREMAEHRLDAILLAAATAQPGQRQAIYFWASNRLQEMVDEGLIDAVAAYDHLFDAAMMSAEPGSEDGVRHAIRVLR